MKVTSLVQGETTIICVAGEFGSELAARFAAVAAEALEAGRRDFVIDLTQTRGLDSTALEAILTLQRKAEEQLGMLRLCVCDATLRTIFRLTRLDQQMSIDRTREEALAGLANVYGAAGAGGRS